MLGKEASFLSSPVASLTPSPGPEKPLQILSLESLLSFCGSHVNVMSVIQVID